MKKKLISLWTILAMVVALFAIPVFADGTKVVTIGQDLSDEQEAFIIQYFGVDLSTAEVIYVNNKQEREYVGSWIPLEQIGNITISSAYVQPTQKGGIQVKTANLTYVTGNMIASVLSTAGVKNCNVVAAAPFPVSGTGALTGVMIAYQKATGHPLDPHKRDLAIKEFTITQQTAEKLGDKEALQVVNAVKAEVIRSGVKPEDTIQIQQIVNQVVNNVENNYIDNSVTNIDNSVTNIDNSTTNIDNSTHIVNSLTEEDRQLLINLAEDIAEQDYQYEDMRETLQRVEENLAHETNISISIDNQNDITNEPDADNEQAKDGQEADVSTEPEESILEDTKDEMIDAMYQSSTREEDIIAIDEQAEPVEIIPASQIHKDEPQESPEYDMSMVEEYYEEDPLSIMSEPEEEHYEEDPLSLMSDPEQDDISEEDIFSSMESMAEEFPESEQPEYEEPDNSQPEDVFAFYDDNDGAGIEMEEDFYFFPDEEDEEENQEEYPIDEDGNGVISLIQNPETNEFSYTDPSYPEEEDFYTYPDDQEDIPWDIFSDTDYTEIVEDNWETENMPEEMKQQKDAWNILAGKAHYDLSADISDLFERAMKEEGNYKPVALLATQVVAGTNYGFLAVEEEASEDTLYAVSIYENLSGDVSVNQLKKISLDDLEFSAAEPEADEEMWLSGGWQAKDEFPETSLSEKEQKMIADSCDKNQKPMPLVISVLGQKEEPDCIEYAFLCGQKDQNEQMRTFVLFISTDSATDEVIDSWNVAVSFPSIMED